MKLTLIRTDKKNRQHLTTKTLERFAERVTTDTKLQLVSELRREIPFMSSERAVFPKLEKLPRVYPAAEWRIDERGDLQMVSFNGVVLLSIGQLMDAEQLEAAKQVVTGLPSTVMAVVGASWRTLKILVAVEAADGRKPASEEEADTLYQTAHAYAVRVYGGVTGREVTVARPSVRDSFRMTLDQAPFVNAKATPLKVTEELKAADSGLKDTASATDKSSVASHETTLSRNAKYDEVEFLYRRVADEVYEVLDTDEWRQSPYREEAAVSEIARRLCQLGVEEEETVAHLHSHLWSREDERHIRSVVASSYEAVRERKPKADPALKAIEASARVRRDTLALIAFLGRRYQMRYNTVMGYAEYRPNNQTYYPWRPVDERVVNDLAMEARTEGLDVWDKDVKRYVNSSYAPRYSPVEDYLWECRGKWDGRDRIRELARTVPTQNPYWEEWFYTWFLAMVNQWRATEYTRYGNSAVPLLISKQGWNKSTFCQSLLPMELQWGYTQTAKPSEEKQMLLQMSQMLLVNFDEFNKISPQVQQGFLKNMLSLPVVKAKRPYGKHVEVMPRLSSFIATTNLTDVLSDPTGSRRFLAVELTGPIDVSHLPNHRQLFAQALAALDRGEPTWFDEVQTQQIMDYNRQFQLLGPAEQFFGDLFRPAVRLGEPGAQWMSASDLFQQVRAKVGSSLHVSNLQRFGRTLANMPELLRRVTNQNTQYLVVKRQK